MSETLPTAPSPRPSDHESSVFGAGVQDSRQPYPETWQPIETAPKGRVILLFAVTDLSENGEVTHWKMATGSTPFAGPIEWIWDGYRLREWDVQPTHWMPLPLPPATDASVPDAGAVTDGTEG